MADGYSTRATAKKLYFSRSSLYRWRKKASEGRGFLADRTRSPIAGVMPQAVQDALIHINANHPQLHFDELSLWLEVITGWRFSERQVRQFFMRGNFRYNLIHEYRPLEQDAALFRFWAEEVITANGPIKAKQLTYLDEASKRKRDAMRTRVHVRRGDRVRIRVPVGFRDSKYAASIVIAVGLHGIVTAIPVDVEVDGNISK
jgi:transposase